MCEEVRTLGIIWEPASLRNVPEIRRSNQGFSPMCGTDLNLQFFQNAQSLVSSYLRLQPSLKKSMGK